MLLCVMLCLVICSFTEAAVQHPNDVDDTVPKLPVDKGPFEFHNNPLWNYNDTLKPHPWAFGVPKSKAKITNVSKKGPPFYVTLDGTGSVGIFFKWKQLDGDNVGYTRFNSKTFVYHAKSSGSYVWSLRVCTLPFKCDTDFASHFILNLKPVARARMYWLGNSIYMDGSQSTDDHDAIVSYRWKQIRGDKPGYQSSKKSFVYQTNKFNKFYAWRLTVCDAEGKCHKAVVRKHFGYPGIQPSVKAVIDAHWFTYHVPFFPMHVMQLSGAKSTGQISKYVWIMEQGAGSGMMKFGKEMTYFTHNSGWYVWRLLVIGFDNTHHHTWVGHIFSHLLIFHKVPGDLKAIPKLIQGIDGITLDATSSTGDISRVQWEQTSGDYVGDTFSEPHFSIPYPRSGECTYKLTVFDKDGEMSEEEVSLPDGGLDNWRELIGEDGGDLVEEPDTPPEKLVDRFDEVGNPVSDVGNDTDRWPSPIDAPLGEGENAIAP